MTSPQRTDHQLQTLLADMYVGGTPDYRDSLVQRIADVRQRPAWTFPGRWLPMDTMLTRAPVPGVPWRTIGILALLALLAGAMAIALVGSRPRPPEPFGPAANGMLVYSDNGDVFVRDAPDGAQRLVVGGLDNDLAIGFSRQGTELLFLRAGVGANPSTLWVVEPDGRDARQLDGEYRVITGVDWSPQGDLVAISHSPRGVGVITIAPTDGGPATTLELDVHATEVSWRPPDGRQLSFRGQEGDRWGQYLVNRDGSGLRRLDLVTERMFRTDYDVRGARWSDDGQRLLVDSLHNVEAGNGSGLRIHIVDIDPDGAVLADRRFDFEDTVDDELNARWLPDNRLVYQRRLGNEDVGIVDSLRVAFLAEGARSIDIGVTSPYPDGISYEVSPDGARLIAITWADGKTYETDLATYQSKPAGFASDEGASWQRRAP